MFENRESIQLLNTAIIKSKEKKIDNSYEDRLSKTCQQAAIEALGIATVHLAESQKISRDQAASQIIEAIRELDTIWNDYVMMEGINKLKEALKNKKTTH